MTSTPSWPGSPWIPEGRLATSPDKKGTLSAEAEAHTHVERLRRAAFRVTKVERKERKRSPAPPFTTSTLQQEAARKLGFGARKTMTIAQRLYEGVDLPGEGTVGLITYMRTDSVNLAESALREIAGFIRTSTGPSTRSPSHAATGRARGTPRRRTRAIRPTSVLRHPARVSSALERDQLRLYTSIWQRTVASQMAEARFNQVGVDVEAAVDGLAYGLRATGQTSIFDGFIRVYRRAATRGPTRTRRPACPSSPSSRRSGRSTSCPSSTSRSRRPGTPRPSSSRRSRSSNRPAVHVRLDHLDDPGLVTSACRTSASTPRTSPRS